MIMFSRDLHMNFRYNDNPVILTFFACPMSVIITGATCNNKINYKKLLCQNRVEMYDLYKATEIFQKLPFMMQLNLNLYRRLGKMLKVKPLFVLGIKLARCFR